MKLLFLFFFSLRGLLSYENDLDWVKAQGNVWIKEFNICLGLGLGLSQHFIGLCFGLVFQHFLELGLVSQHFIGLGLRLVSQHLMGLSLGSSLDIFLGLVLGLALLFVG